MPGLLASVAVEQGQEVKAGEALAVVEAMKMENVLRAARDGTVKTLHAKAGDSLRGRPEDHRVRLRLAMALQARLTITGRVQGVGYRDWAIATGLRLGLPAGCATAPTARSRR